MLQNKIIVITGACGLIGKEYVRTILKQNGIPVIADINKTVLSEFEQELKAEKFNDLLFLELDITNKESVLSAINDTYKKYGKIDALVNNAYPRNKNYGKDLESVEYVDFTDNVSKHLGGYFLCMQQFSIFFKKQGHGNIVNMSSIYGVVSPRFDIYEGSGFTMPVEYAAIKSSIIHLTKYFVKYYKGANIRFNCISPGGINNNQPEKFSNLYKTYSANKGMLDKEDLTGTLTFLLSDMSKAINGQNIIVDDGWSL